MASILDLLDRPALAAAARSRLHPIERIARNIRVTDGGCWEWSRVLSTDGYAAMTITAPGYDPVRVLVHRASYELHKGPIPTGAQLDHLCRNRACCNPDHLEPVTNRENTLRSSISLGGANASKTHCLHGHEFTPENTYVKKGRHGHPERVCRTCRLARQRARSQELNRAS